MDNTQVKYLILGGGISGISFAHFLKDDNHLILEKEPTLGGLCRSFRVGNSTFDFSGHFSHFKDNDLKNYVLSLVNKHRTGKFEEFKREACISVVDNGERVHVNYPFQANIHQLSKSSFIECLTDLYFAARLGMPELYRSFEDLVTSTFGKALTNIFFKPYNEKLYRTRLGELDADAMKRFVPKVSFEDVMENIRDSKRFGYNDTFLYSPTSGAQCIVDAFVAEQQLNYSLNESVVSIDLATKTVKTTKREVEYEFLVNTLPLNVFTQLTQYAHDVNFKSVDVHVYNITYTDDVSLIRDKAWAYFPGDELFYRVGFYSFMSGAKNTSIYVEVSATPGSQMQELDVIDSELKKAHVIKEDACVEVAQMLAISPAYVILEKTTDADVNKLLHALSIHNVHSLGRYGTWTYSSIGDDIASAKKLAESFNN